MRVTSGEPDWSWRLSSIFRVDSRSSAAVFRVFLLLWIAGQTLFWLAWWVGYQFLPVGAVRGVGLAAGLPLENLDPWPQAAAILGWNLMAAGLFVGVTNLMRWGKLPLGVIPVLYFWGMYGLLLGSNSFGVAMPERAAPSLVTLLQRVGFYEITAYTLVAWAVRRPYGRGGANEGFYGARSSG